MPKISVYLNKDLYERIRSYAKDEDSSISGFISGVLKKHIDENWPKGFFEKYIGSIKDESFDVPRDIPWELNILRESLDDD
jgi:hypothetical protein